MIKINLNKIAAVFTNQKEMSQKKCTALLKELRGPTVEKSWPR